MKRLRRIGLIKIFVIVFSALFIAVSAQAAMEPFSFDKIDHWVGSGSNKAAFVVDWHDGIAPEAMVWGFRWDGTATGEDMLTAVVKSDSNLYAKVSGQTSYGIALFGLGYDMDNDGFDISDGSQFVNGLTSAGYTTADGASATDTGDKYNEGWYQGFWSYWLSNESRLAADGSDWGFSGTGMTGRVLSDGDVDGWGFDSDMSTWGDAPPSAPYAAAPAPVPVPGALWLMGSGLLGLVCFRRRKSA